jgi:hypothetical protein
VGKTSAPARPLPSREGPNGEFHARCARGQLAFQECRSCGRLQHPPRLQCPACGGEDLGWRESSGRGRIYTWTVTHQAFHPAFAGELPYAIAVTELEEGVRLVSGVRGLAPGQLALDLPVEVVLEPVAEGVALPFVRPRGSRPG